MDHAIFEGQRFAHILVYGAGTTGRQVRDYLENEGHAVAGFLDRDPAFSEVCGLPVSTAQGWAAAHDPATACVVMGIFNNNVDIGPVADMLARLGYGRLISLPEFVRHYPDDQPFRYWLAAPQVLEANVERIANFRAHLADDASRELLDAVVAFRAGTTAYLPEPTPRQYFPEDLPPWPQPVRLIDCGAYTGDTVLDMHEAKVRFEAIATFEPNLGLYQTLVENLRSFGALNFPCGVSNGNRQARFDGSQGSGGHLQDDGDEQVVCVSLDDALPGFAPTLIKMDIEGEEPQALEGAKYLLREFKPDLAIAIYHRAEQLWTLFEQIEGYGLGYHYYLRAHAWATFELVLYAVKPPMPARLPH